MLRQKIQQDLIQAIKGKQGVNSSTLRLLLAAVFNREKEKRYKLGKEKPEMVETDLVKEAQLSNEEIIQIISSEIKKRKEAILGYERGGRKDLMEKEKNELEILRQYLSKQMPVDETSSHLDASLG